MTDIDRHYINDADVDSAVMAAKTAFEARVFAPKSERRARG